MLHMYDGGGGRAEKWWPRQLWSEEVGNAYC